jgi:hypothetical protein
LKLLQKGAIVAFPPQIEQFIETKNPAAPFKTTTQILNPLTKLVLINPRRETLRKPKSNRLGGNTNWKM